MDGVLGHTSALRQQNLLQEIHLMDLFTGKLLILERIPSAMPTGSHMRKSLDTDPAQAGGII